MKATNYFKSKPSKPVDVILNRLSNRIFINTIEEKNTPIKIDREKILKKIIEEKKNK